MEKKDFASRAINPPSFVLTSDESIRADFKVILENKYSNAMIVEEFGITHGAARIDIAVINGEIHGYEIKSDLDTLDRLPEQMRIYNSVLDKVTLVVGKKHLFEAINIVPEWWGITIAKIPSSGEKVAFYEMRLAEENPCQDKVAIASLLWREEALSILEEIDQAKGVRSKPRKTIYERLVEVVDNRELKGKILEYLFLRVNWRSEIQCMLNDD
ncbi:MAG: sce7726 family protein [Thermodesulfovibrionales bacterium]|nr:sce7726 family protein [Thermodesulfovibrionales bacterium]